jgi:hypothetical protein
VPPRLHSRHSFTKAYTDGDKQFLTQRVPFPYEDRRDNVVYIVKDGDFLEGLAARMFAPLNDPPTFSAASLWWVIMDYQPTPIHDPTIRLVAGTKLIIPSLRTVQDRVFNLSYRRKIGHIR